MTAPLILRDPSGPPDEHDVVMMLNDFTARDPAAILADLRGQGAPRPGSGRAGMKKMPAPAMSPFSPKVDSVRGRSLGGIDHQHFDRAPLRVEFESELFLQRRKERWAIDWR